MLLVAGLVVAHNLSPLNSLSWAVQGWSDLLSEGKERR